MGYDLPAWKTEAGQLSACMKKDTQSVNCCDTAREEGRLIVFNVLRELGQLRDIDGQT